MKNVAMLCACVLLGCGGSAEEAREPVEPAPTQAAIDPATTAMNDQAMAPQPTAPATPSETAGQPAAPEPQATAPSVARAILKSIPAGAEVGTLSFESQNGQITITGEVQGLKAGAHALYIHEKGDCGNKGKNAGGHFNPTSTKHGPPSSSERHAGDFGDLTVEQGGAGSFSMTTDSITIAPEGADSVVGRAVIVHAKKDDKAGNAGPAIACGVIELAGG